MLENSDSRNGQQRGKLIRSESMAERFNFVGERFGHESTPGALPCLGTRVYNRLDLCGSRLQVSLSQKDIRAQARPDFVKRLSKPSILRKPRKINGFLGGSLSERFIDLLLHCLTARWLQIPHCRFDVGMTEP